MLRESPRINRAQVKGKGNEIKLYLTISETELDDSGRFEVIARNSEGEASDSSRLTVKRKPFNLHRVMQNLNQNLIILCCFPYTNCNFVHSVL